MLDPRLLSLSQIVIRIIASIIAGGLIGVERGLKNRPAGLRTYMLVTVGSCMVMLINQYAYQVYQTGDPVRLGAQVVSGIGFLGAGTIIVTSHNQIRGLTTAAGLWASASVGLAIGIGFYEAAIFGVGAIFIILTVIHEWDYQVRAKTHEMDAYIELAEGMPLGKFIRNCRDLNLDISNIQREQEGEGIGTGEAFTITIKSKTNLRQVELSRSVRKIEGVKYLEVL